MAEFVIPEFLQNHSTDDIHEKMIDILPDDLDVSEGGHAWNFTRPTALVAAELCEYILPGVIQMIFPEWSYDEYLDAHARARNLKRKPSTTATGILVITGPENLFIPAGSLFSTTAVSDGSPSVDYETTEDATIPESGSVEINICCTEEGIVGNTGANTVVIVSSRLSGISTVTNPEAITGGVEEEDDESLRERIIEYDRNQGDSFTGNAADYKRWATSVPGVGDATIISATDDTGLVTIILTDANGDPATTTMCASVYNYIMRPDDPGERLAPINAYLKVVPPETMDIGIRATVELEDEATIDSVKAAYLVQLSSYLSVALEEGEIKHTRIAAALSATEGVADFTDLEIGVKSGSTISFGTANISIETNQLPTVEESDLDLTSGTV